jgi:hypothetical protein
LYHLPARERKREMILALFWIPAISFLFLAILGPEPGTSCLLDLARLPRQAPYHLSYSSSSFCIGFFQDRVSRTICLGWLRTVIFLISASRVARITGMSHQCLASCCILEENSVWSPWCPVNEGGDVRFLAAEHTYVAPTLISRWNSTPTKGKVVASMAYIWRGSVRSFCWAPSSTKTAGKTG